MRILLVGGNGFIGRHLMTALLAEGHRIVATSRRGQGPELPGVTWQSLDLGRLGRDGHAFDWPAGTALVINAAGLLTSDAGNSGRYRTAVVGLCSIWPPAMTHRYCSSRRWERVSILRCRSWPARRRPMIICSV
ncbi:NAD-dependent epimerase/dehydratase family protein [Modicisalibacter luteus]|uniref:NAD-dependent epimerase/dehydratase family protein n=1 Tax=Modicisalibacter luteus TaxID=453962 RepID=UPI00363880EB